MENLRFVGDYILSLFIGSNFADDVFNETHETEAVALCRRAIFLLRIRMIVFRGNILQNLLEYQRRPRQLKTMQGQ
jgi:hypothetical protein